MRVILPILLSLSACSLQTQLGGKGTTPTGGASNGQATMPEVLFMTRDDAIKALKSAGFSGTISEGTSACGSVVDGRVVEKGHVCQQHPPAGRVQGGRLPVSILVQHEDPRHGSIGKSSEWHLMPDVVGMPLDKAYKVLADAGLTNRKRLREERVGECKPNIVCRTYPEKLSRIAQDSDKLIYVGIDPNAKPPVVEKPPVEAKPEPTDEDSEEKKPELEEEPEDFF